MRFPFRSSALLSLVLCAPLAAQAAQPDLDTEAAQVFGLTRAAVVPVDLAGTRGASATATFEAEGTRFVLDLAPHKALADGFQLLEDRGDDVLVSVPYTAPATYRGSVEGVAGSRVAATWLDDGLYARIDVGDGNEWWVQPALPQVAGATLAQHVVYRTNDVIPRAGVCGTDLLPNRGYVNGPPAISPGSTVQGITQPFVCELACDADFEYFQRYGTSTATMNQITTVIDTMNLEYERDVNITHQLTTIIVRTTSNDPYVSTDASTMLNEFAAEWNTNQTSVQRDVAQLYTGKNIQGSTIGISFVSTICNTGSAYSVVQSDCCGGLSCATDLSAHELGHSWSANHCTCTAYTMNPFITCANQFSPTFTIPGIIGFRDSRNCLDGGPDPFAGFSGTPRSGDAPLSVAFTDESTGTSLSSWSWDFGDGFTSSQQNPTHVYSAGGTFDVSLTVNGVNGSDTKTQTAYVVVTDPILASCTSRNGSGTNPLIYNCVNTPVLGTTWTSTVDAGSIGASGISIQFGYGGSSQIPTVYGEVLINPMSQFVFSSISLVIGGTATHQQPVPNDETLEGFPVYTQVFLNGSGVLTNALDVVLGK